LRSLELLRSVFFFFLFSLIRYDLNLANWCQVVSVVLNIYFLKA
jgi:hypothetical protein